MIVEHIADFVNTMSYERLPPQIRDHVRRSLVDTIGVSVGALEIDTSQAMQAYLARSLERGPSTGIGSERRLSPRSAAFLNGTLGHSLDYDDTHYPTIIHPSACVVPAALAIGEQSDAPLGELIAAIALGQEVASRMGMAAFDARRQLSLLTERGLHPTSVTGAVGAAVAAGKLLGLDREGIAHAIAMALNMACGTIEPNRGGGNIKRMYAGWAAQSGVVAAELAALGFLGPLSCFEGRFGFFAAFLSGDFDEKPLTKGLGQEWELLGIGLKPFPCNVFTHSAAEAASVLGKEIYNVDCIDRVDVYLPTRAVPIVGDPIESKRRPRNSHEARFSVPYIVARGLMRGEGTGVTDGDFADDSVKCPATIALAAKVDVHAATDLDAKYPMQLGARIVTHVGERRLEHFVASSLGSPSRPLKDEVVRAKFLSVASTTINSETAAALFDAIFNLAATDPVSHLTRVLHYVSRPTASLV